MDTPEGSPEVSPRPIQYEFSPADNELIRDLAGKMRFVGMCLIIGAILAALAGVLNLVQARSQGAGNLIQGIIYLVIGLLTYQAGGSFRKIVETHGTDIRYLMDALGSLRVLYRIQFWLVLIAIIFIPASMILMIIAAMFK